MLLLQTNAKTSPGSRGTFLSSATTAAAQTQHSKQLKNSEKTTTQTHTQATCTFKANNAQLPTTTTTKKKTTIEKVCR
jgi:hypothetical protein